MLRERTTKELLRRSENMLGQIFKFLKKKKPCYRCGGNASVEYMALLYCRICREVVVRMIPVIGMGGMFGFPGSTGYLEFPSLEKKES
jgi:hypothetical protein